MKTIDLIMYYFKVVIVSLMVLNLVEFVLCQGQEANKIPKTIGTITTQPTTTTPDKLAVPKGNNFAFLLNAKGNQRYKCIAPASAAPGQLVSGFWSISDSDALLINDKSENGQNFVPAFEVVHYNISTTPNNGGNYTWTAALPGDNSVVIGKLEESVNSIDDKSVPWERYAATFRQDGGRLSNISYILKVNTNGGAAPPADQCGIQYRNDIIQSVSYEADYWFYEGPLPGSDKPAAPPRPSNNNTVAKSNNGYSTKTLRNKIPLLSMSIGPGQLGWVAIISFVSVGVVFF